MKSQNKIQLKLDLKFVDLKFVKLKILSLKMMKIFYYKMETYTVHDKVDAVMFISTILIFQ